MKKTAWTILSLALVIAGCASVAPDPGLDESRDGEALVAQRSVRIDVDEDGIHHVHADSDTGVAFGEGCVDAETVGPIVLAHSILTSGHASEAVEPELLGQPRFPLGMIPHHFAWDSDGYITLDGTASLTDIDKTMLLVRAPQNAAIELASLSTEDRAVLDAFVDGFNHCFARSRDRWVLQYPWLDGFGMQDEALRAQDVLARLTYFFRWGEITMARAAYERVLQEPATPPPAVEIPIPDYEGASNQWWFDGRHMADGRAVHVSDPHIPMALAQPYGIATRSAVGRYFGGGLVGVPGMVFGTTLHADGSVAWSPTAAGPDGADIFEVHPVDGGYLTSEGGVEPFASESHTVAGQPFALRTGRYGRVYGRHPQTGTLLALRSTLDAPLRTFEFIRRSNAARSIAELHASLTDADGNGTGLHALNILATDNTDAAYLLTGRVPRRGADPGALYGGVSDSLDPQDEWTGGLYAVREMPQSVNPASGYAANCNVSPGLTDPRIGYDFPLSMIVSPTALSSWRQESFSRRAPGFVDAGPATVDDVLAFAGETHDEHWAAVTEVLLQTYLTHGDPLGLIGAADLTDGSGLPFAYEVLAWAISRGREGTLRADIDDELAAALYDYVDRLQRASGLHPQIAAIAGAGRPFAVTVLDLESARIAFELWVDTIDHLLEAYAEAPTLGDMMKHCWIEPGLNIVCESSFGSGGSFRNVGGPVIRDAQGRIGTALYGGHSMLLVTHLGAAGEPVTVELQKPYGTDDWSDPLASVLPRRFAAGQFTSVALDPAQMRIARTQMVP